MFPFSFKQCTAFSAIFLLLNGFGLPVALSAEKSQPVVQQETIKARASVWRESSNGADNPTDLTIHTVFPEKQWWEQFQDPHLSRYIQQAVNNNLDLAAAHQRVLEARALARQSLGRELPQVSLGASFTRSRNSATIIPAMRSGGNTSSSSSSSGSGSSSGGSIGGGGFALGRVINNYTIPLAVSYEADIWRKNRDATRAAKQETQAAERDFQATHVIVATDVANAYFNLLAADELLALQKDIVTIAEADLGHAQRRYEAGLVDEEDVVLRQGRLTNFKAELQTFYESQALALNQLALLMGQTPQQVAELPRASWQQYEVPAEVAAGLPSDLLARRPDILSAEERLEAAGFRVRVARKEMLPTLNLSGQFGFATATRNMLFDWQSYIASVAGSLVQPIFTGGQKKANLQVYKARYEQQLLAYRDAVLQSFREVDDSLASLKAHRNAYQEYAASLSSLQQRQRIQQNRLEAGAISEADINPVRLEVTQAMEGLTRTKLAALTDTLSLYKALGGGY
ncbi:MAG: efflux system, outer rane lipoprotein NodT [Vampirovibrio sp.]|jgi:NodT family efflux transporter outer membrane factor (OMF) lipoprotein|nr:efflux system, outer rane lipoprotein NodT [Vampirovibrio sp.]